MRAFRCHTAEGLQNSVSICYKLVCISKRKIMSPRMKVGFCLWDKWFKLSYNGFNRFNATSHHWSLYSGILPLKLSEIYLSGLLSPILRFMRLLTKYCLKGSTILHPSPLVLTGPVLVGVDNGRFWMGIFIWSSNW